MVLERKQHWNFVKGREIQGENNVYSTSQRKELRSDPDAGIEQNHRSVGYGKQCLLVWACVEE